MKRRQDELSNKTHIKTVGKLYLSNLYVQRKKILQNISLTANYESPINNSDNFIGTRIC